MAWELEVRDVFRFSDGRTVFIGSAESAPSVISGACDLLVDAEVIGQIEVTEELPERREPLPGERAVGTLTDTGITTDTIQEHDVRLRASE